MATINKVLSVAIEQKIDSWKSPKLNYRSGVFYSTANRLSKNLMRTKLKEKNIEEINTTNPIVLSFCFVFKMPERWKRAKPYPSKKDITNCQKLFEDALKGYIYEDDRQVVAINDFKVWGEKDCIIIEVFEIQNDSMFQIDCPTIFKTMNLAIESLKNQTEGCNYIIFDGLEPPN